MRTKLAGGLILLLLLFITSLAIAKEKEPIELNADSISYDSTKSIIIAEGNVKITQNNSVITGQKAEYSTKTQEADITGGVRAVKEDTTLTADELRSLDKNHMKAIGNVVMVKGESQLTGPQADYYADKQTAIVIGGAQLKNPDGIMTAFQVEVFFAEDRATGKGNVHIVIDIRKLDAHSDNALYYGKKNTGSSGKLILTGNATAVQDVNHLTGETLTIYLDDKSMNAQGRTKLIIKPQ